MSQTINTFVKFFFPHIGNSNLIFVDSLQEIFLSSILILGVFLAFLFPYFIKSQKKKNEKNISLRPSAIQTI